MAYVVVENFSLGLDTRRHPLTARPGTLQKLVNAHITRGGEVEKRKKFAQFASLPANTFGLLATDGNLYVFGSVAAPVTPSGVTYQRLQHPQGFAMTKVVHAIIYGGKPYVIAEFSDGKRFSFWDGTVIDDWYIGVATSAMAGLDDLAEQVKNDFSISGYTISRTGSSLTVVGPIGKEFEVSATATSPMTTTVSKTQSSKIPVGGEYAKGSFAVSAGTESPAKLATSLRFIDGNALPGITGIYVNGVEITGLSPGSTIRWDSTAYTGWDLGPRFALTLATFINDNTANSGYTAENKNGQLSGLDSGKITILADSALGSSANGYTVQFEFEADPTGTSGLGELVDGSATASPYNVGRFVMSMSGGGVLAGGAYSGVTSVKVDGVEVMGETVPWKESNSATMVAVVAAINTYSSNPEYTAELVDGKVILTSASSGASTNGRVISASIQGDTVVSSVVSLAGGTDGYIGQSQMSVVALGGTFTVGGKFSVSISDNYDSINYSFGASRVAGLQPTCALTYQSKEYVASGSALYFSAVNSPTKWDLYDTGSGFINMSNNAGGNAVLTGLAIYQGHLAAFARRAVQVWYMDPDPANNRQGQVVSSTGALGHKAVVSVGEIDVFYLSDSGIRSLRARDSSNTAVVNDIGTPIDSLVLAELAGMTDDQKAACPAVIEPIDGRYWIAIGQKIYVFSYFPNSQVSAWSVYEPGFSVSDFAAKDNRLYARSGDTIYLYGGTTNSEYDDCQVEVVLPFLDAGKPAHEKRLGGVDMTVEGWWEVFIGMDPYAPDARDRICEVNSSTFSLGRIAASGWGTHIGVRLLSQSPGYARLGNLIAHFDFNEAD